LLSRAKKGRLAVPIHTLILINRMPFLRQSLVAVRLVSWLKLIVENLIAILEDQACIDKVNDAHWRTVYAKNLQRFITFRSKRMRVIRRKFENVARLSKPSFRLSSRHPRKSLSFEYH